MIPSLGVMLAWHPEELRAQAAALRNASNEMETLKGDFDRSTDLGQARLQSWRGAAQAATAQTVGLLTTSIARLSQSAMVMSSVLDNFAHDIEQAQSTVVNMQNLVNVQAGLPVIMDEQGVFTMTLADVSQPDTLPGSNRLVPKPGLPSDVVYDYSKYQGIVITANAMNAGALAKLNESDAAFSQTIRAAGVSAITSAAHPTEAFSAAFLADPRVMNLARSSMGALQGRDPAMFTDAEVAGYAESLATAHAANPADGLWDSPTTPVAPSGNWQLPSTGVDVNPDNKMTNLLKTLSVITMFGGRLVDWAPLPPTHKYAIKAFMSGTHQALGQLKPQELNDFYTSNAARSAPVGGLPASPAPLQIADKYVVASGVDMTNNPTDLANQIRNDPAYRGQQIVIADARRVEGVSEGYSQSLADQLGTTVSAPMGEAWSDDRGNIFATTVTTDNRGNATPTWPPDQSWEVRAPR